MSRHRTLVSHRLPELRAITFEVGCPREPTVGFVINELGREAVSSESLDDSIQIVDDKIDRRGFSLRAARHSVTSRSRQLDAPSWRVLLDLNFVREQSAPTTSGRRLRVVHCDRHDRRIVDGGRREDSRSW